MGFFDRFVPELVKISQKAQAENPRPVLAPSYPEPSNAEKAQGYGLAAWIVQIACAFISLFLALHARKLALEELRAIVEGRRSPAGRQKAIMGYWLGQGLIWIWWFTIALILITGVIVIPIVILTS